MLFVTHIEKDLFWGLFYSYISFLIQTLESQLNYAHMFSDTLYNRKDDFIYIFKYNIQRKNHNIDFEQISIIGLC